jgi:NAD(P)-dependent dehydrogenase (short-subunit alcohol dehydrogenase family)
LSPSQVHLHHLLTGPKCELATKCPESTPLFADVTDTPALRQIPGFEKILATAQRKNPSRRLTQPEDVARTIAALCHPATYWPTGNVLHVDGGENIVG